jgi:hypothetical protein
MDSDCCRNKAQKSQNIFVNLAHFGGRYGTRCHICSMEGLLPMPIS